MATKRRKRRRNGRYGLWGIVILAAVVIALIALLTPSVSLSASRVTVEVGGEFDPYQYVTVRNAKKEELKITNPTDTSALGEYTVVYTLESKEKTLTVSVVDTVAPVLTAKDPIPEFLPGQTIDPEKLVLVEDQTDVALTLDAQGQSLTAPGTYTCTVSGTDGGGNTASCSVTLQILNPDTEAPVIDGVVDLTLYTGNEFDPSAGVTVTDNLDESPTLTVDDGGLDLNKAGTYKVTYTATDASGNQTTAVRTVKVIAPPKGTVMYTPPGGTFSWDATGIDVQPYLVAVNRSHCTTTVYGKDNNGNYTVPVKAFACSVGKPGDETPTGRYTTTDRFEWCYMVDGSYGRYAIRINRGIMFHSVCYYTQDITNLEYEEYNKLGSPASLGCIRLCLRDVKWLYDNCPWNFPVVIYDDSSTPGPLGKPEGIKIDVNDETRRGWDPTDTDPASPWNK